MQKTHTKTENNIPKTPLAFFWYVSKPFKKWVFSSIFVVVLASSIGISVAYLFKMIVDSVELAAWTYFSPSYLQSELKGLYRNALLMAIAKYMGHKTLKTLPDDSNQPIEWERYFYKMNTGLEFGKQTNLSPKTGKLTKSRRSFDQKSVTNKPDEIVKHLFGPKYNAKDILTFEDAYKAIMSSGFPHKSIRKKVFQEAANMIQNKGYPIPKEIDKQT